MKKIKTHKERLLEAASTLKAAVTPTLGPAGSQVILHSSFQDATATKDGVTVAKHFRHPDPKTQAIVSILTQAASKTNLTQGDGTTTSILLATTLLEELLKYSDSTSTPLPFLAKELNNLLPSLLKSIDEHTTPASAEDLLSIATISSNNDPITGKLVYDTFMEVGPEGVILLEESPAPFTTSSLTNGYSVDSPYLSPHFINTPNREVVYENPLILITDSKLRNSTHIIPFLQYLAQESRPGIIIADDIDPQILQMLIVNVLNTPLRVTAIKAPSFGENRANLLQDLATYTSSSIVSESKGLLVKDFDPASLGTATKVVITDSTSTFLCNPSPAIDRRVEEIENQIPSLNPYFQAQYQKRAASLRSKVATIHVGAPTDSLRASLKDQIEDAIRSIRQASLHGVIPGGGTIPFLLSTNTTFTPLRKALEAPISLIAFPNQEVVKDVILRNPLVGYNALTSTYEDLRASGVIDPASTLKEALTTAVSVASLLASTHDVVAQLNESE